MGRKRGCPRDSIYEQFERISKPASCAMDQAETDERNLLDDADPKDDDDSIDEDNFRIVGNPSSILDQYLGNFGDFEEVVELEGMAGRN
ncbi:hypothetical protein PBRA_006591 [Plasmodiophora brassicae]|uniref:Uncharacterized protein n=1 Tax=Plasmodiophora brassicae TaxID=37360 RepID=A0A0G4ITC0_PLABS|nr:hypothetical protein PBRA_006591 [Plasmodiophora brassicae]